MKEEGTRCYAALMRLDGFKERFEYLKLGGTVGEETFGFERYLNQRFYHSAQWRRIRDYVIARDLGCDLGVAGHDIRGAIVIHHMNPIRAEDIRLVQKEAFDPEFLICVTHRTHNAIHYGDAAQLPAEPILRRPNDTAPWRTVSASISEQQIVKHGGTR